MLFTPPENVANNIQNFTGRSWLLAPLLEWLGQSDDRVFILTGEPGAGKSMTTAWLAGAGPVPTEAGASLRLEQTRLKVKATHFCIATSGNAPKAFAQNVAEQLTRTVPGFGSVLATTLSDLVKISAEQRINTVETGGSVTGIYIEQLNLGLLGDALSFDRTLRDPLKRLYEGGYQEPMLLLVDALDESATYTGDITIVRLLARLNGLSKQIRLLVTTRPDPRVLKYYQEAKIFDLIKDAPPDVNDVRLYAYERLAVPNDAQRSLLADRISKAAEGNFLYASMVLDELQPRLPAVPDLTMVQLPKGLRGLYHQFLNRELGTDEDRWYETFKPLLGLIAVAQGEGLSRTQLSLINGKDIEQALRACKQYLNGTLPDGPFRPFHRSFVDFLLEEKENIDYHIDGASMHQQIADHYLALQDSQGPWHKWDDYGLRYTATHLAEAAGGSLQPERRYHLLERLVKLVVNRDFQEVHKERVKDLAALQRDLVQALRSAALDHDSRVLPLVIEIALGLVVFRREQLRPELLFDLARRGEVEAATRQLDLFDVDLHWQQAVQLTIAWLASQRNPDEARKLRDHLKRDLPPSGPLPLLLNRLNATLEGTPLPMLDLPDTPPPEQQVRELVARMGGLGPYTELLVTGGGLKTLVQPNEMLAATGYLAEQDGLPLVAYAAAHPQEGDQYFRHYLVAHMAYNYVQYRNNSLWLLLGAVLHHPDQEWVQTMMSELAKVALAGSTLEFQESLSLTIQALQVLAGKPGILQVLEERRDQVVVDASQLAPGRGHGDAWGSYKRRLAALAQTFALLLDRKADADALLNQALNLPYAFAGFQSPACLTLAEAICVCFPHDAQRISDALYAAQRAAHNIQHSTFCALMTARFNATVRRWWGSPPAGFDIAGVQRLSQEPDTAEFAALHLVGEPYQFRELGPDKLPLPEWVLQANTLEKLADLYQHPLTEFQRLNRESGWTGTEELPEGTAINVPDPEFAPLLAARFAAEILVETSLSEQKRVELVQSLVPIAASNPTALDTTLTRLLLAARPSEPGMLDTLEQIAEHSIIEGSSGLEVLPPS